MDELRITFGEQEYRFQPGQPAQVGRASGNDVVVSDPTVSRRHARFTWSPQGWVLENLGRSGTFLGGQPVTRLALTGPAELALASPEGPVIRVEPPGRVDPAPAGTPASVPAPDPAPVPGPPGPPPGSRDELATAFQILVPVKSWLTDPGWRQGLRLLVIPYALLPLVFMALFGSSHNLSTPGWAYSLYIAPLWAIAFWLLIRPRPAGLVELLAGVAIIAWVLIWMSIVTAPVDGHLHPRDFGGALGIGFNEEIAKALPILVTALLLLKLRQVKLDVRMWMFLGTIAGLAFGVREASLYTTQAIERIAVAASVHSANLAVLGALSFAFRVFVDGFQHAIWAGVAAFFIGMAVNYPRRRSQLIVFGITIAAVLHGLNDWIVYHTSLWPWIFLQAVSLLLFLGYTISAGSIERNVRRTPLFRGDSLLMERFTEPGDAGGA